MIRTDGPQQPQAPESRVIYGVLLALGIVALILQVVGLATPAWLVIDFSTLTLGVLDLEISMGLWVVRYCLNGNCDTKGIDVFWDDIYGGTGVVVTHAMTEYRVETILSALFMTIVVICLTKLMCCSPEGVYMNSKIWWIIPCITSALSAILALIAAGKYGGDVAAAHNLFNTFGTSPYKFPYSIVVEGVGGIVAGLLFIILIIETCRSFSRINAMTIQQNYVMTTYPAGSQPYAPQPYAPQPYGQQPYGQQPYRQQQHGVQAYGNQPDMVGYSGSKHHPPPDYGRRY